MVITKTVWKDILKVLKRHGIPYSTEVGTPGVSFEDLHVQINLVIPDYFDDI